MKPTFSVNDYDKDGDIFEEGIFFHFGDTRIKVTNTVEELSDWPEYIASMITEIKENY
jgi:hypothetical protein